MSLRIYNVNTIAMKGKVRDPSPLLMAIPTE
jgi:hypothetical protein